MTHLKRLTILLLSTALLIACLPLSLDFDSLFMDEATPVSDSTPDADIDVIFTERSPAAEQAIINAIESAQSSIDLAIYNISNENIGDALLAAARRGVNVRMVMENKNLDGVVAQGLAAGGIPIQEDDRDALMHNKFIIIDNLDVWTGSANFTYNGLSSDDNNLVHIRSSRLAENYSTEFEEMFTDGRFGSNSPANTPNPQLSVDGVLLESYFSPDDGVLDHLVDMVEDAETSISIMVFSFTSDELAAAVLDKARQGVSVQIVMDEEQAKSNQGGEYETLRDAGLDVRLDGNSGQMHHKVIIIDGDTVSFGSYNFSNSAERRNDENVIIAHDPQLAGAFMTEFDRIYAEAQP
jgi:phosphatidylserine/phosphatidylglycerophosphate/cardiolipin synthase-like enzyme